MPLGPETPVLPLPPPFPNSPMFEVTEISRYDERGPGWYWNAFVTGEHTGTHFDAPVRWVTGKDLTDNRVDTLPPARFVGPACVIDGETVSPFHVMSATSPFSLTGMPALSMRFGTSHEGLPIGVQLVAAYGCEDVLLRVASQLEQAAPWADRTPPIFAGATAAD